MDVYFVQGLGQSKMPLMVSVCLPSNGKSPLVLEADKALEGGVEFNIQHEKFDENTSQTLWITTNGKCPFHKLALVSLGKEGCYLELGARIGAIFAVQIQPEIVLDAMLISDAKSVCQLVTGVLLRLWKQCDKTSGGTLKVVCSHPEEFEAAFKIERALYDGVAYARAMTVEPANKMPPRIFAERCHKLAEWGVKVDVFDEEQLQELGAGAILNVGKGSSNPPRMIVMEWKGGQKEDPYVAFVGKGVCFDAGGIHLKQLHLCQMKWDKAGGAVVVGLMQTIAERKLPINVVAVVGAVENMPDGAAMKPGDIIPTLAGKTVEIVDTDNEGRLVLADCMWYAQTKYNVDTLIDLGTLTLETMGALSDIYAGIFSEDKELTRELIDAGEKSKERLWQLPMGPQFAEQIVSDCADVKNSGLPGFGESGASAEFLKCFVKPGVRWAHLDIAGVAWSTGDALFNRKGVTGFGVRLLDSWLLTHRLSNGF